MSKLVVKINKQTIKERIECIYKAIDEHNKYLDTSKLKFGLSENLQSDKNFELALARLKMFKEELNELRKLLIKVKMYKLKKHKTILCSLCNLQAKGVKIPESGTNLCYNCIYAAVLEHQTKDHWIEQTDKEKSEKLLECKKSGNSLTPLQAAAEISDILEPCKSTLPQNATKSDETVSKTSNRLEDNDYYVLDMPDGKTLKLYTIDAKDVPAEAWDTTEETDCKNKL